MQFWKQEVHCGFEQGTGWGRALPDCGDPGLLAFALDRPGVKVGEHQLNVAVYQWRIEGGKVPVPSHEMVAALASL